MDKNIITKKIALICYHKNANNIYPLKWIEEYKNSILNQSYKFFDIIEVNYGNDNYRVFENSYFAKKQLPTFVDALKLAIEYCKSKCYDYIFNTNIDDIYSTERIKVQLSKLIEGYSIVSSNFTLADSEGNEVAEQTQFQNLNIINEIDNGHNIICHPTVSYNINFFKDNKYQSNEIPFEDMKLWYRAIKNGETFYICPESLVRYRVHGNQVGAVNNDRKNIT